MRVTIGRTSRRALERGRTMKRLLGFVMAAALVASVAHAQSGSATTQASGGAVSTTQADPPDASANASGKTDASAEMQTDIQHLRGGIEKKGSKVSTEARTKAEAKLAATVERVNEEAAKSEDQV